MLLKKIFIILLLPTLGFALMSEERAMSLYKKTCFKCHGGGTYVSKLYDEFEWKDMFKDDARKLITAHSRSEDAMKKLTSSYFKNRVNDLGQFLIDNSKYSGTIPDCATGECFVPINKDKKSTKSLL
jgi:hypothetical protein